MFHMRFNFKSLSFLQNNFTIFKNHRPFTFEDIKELPRRVVIMRHFCAASRDTFLNHAHVITLEQMPAIADITPNVMFRIFNGNDHV